MLIGREVLCGAGAARRGYLQPSGVLESAGHRQRMVDDEHGHVSGGNAVSNLAFIARLYHEIEAPSCQAERNVSALAHLIGDLRSSMLANKVERIMFTRLNRHVIDEVRELDAAIAQARARVAKSAHISVGTQEERSNMSVYLTV